MHLSPCHHNGPRTHVWRFGTQTSQYAFWCSHKSCKQHPCVSTVTPMQSWLVTQSVATQAHHNCPEQQECFLVLCWITNHAGSFRMPAQSTNAGMPCHTVCYTSCTAPLPRQASTLSGILLDYKSCRQHPCVALSHLCRPS